MFAYILDVQYSEKNSLETANTAPEYQLAGNGIFPLVRLRIKQYSLDIKENTVVPLCETAYRVSILFFRPCKHILFDLRFVSHQTLKVVHNIRK